MTHRLELNFPNPIERPEDLYDRTAQLERIRGIVDSPVRIAVIMGERVTGKTSLLNVVQVLAGKEPNLTVLRLPPVTSRGELMEEILEGMASEANTSLHRLGYRDQAGGFTGSTVAGFADVANKLSAQGNRTFLVCLDELDSMLVNCRNDQSATEILHFIVHVSNMNLPIRFVFTLTRATPQIMRTDATPLITAAHIAELIPWTEHETRKFVEGLLSPNLTADYAAHKLLFAEGGGHPYLTKAILQQIVNASETSVTCDVISVRQVRAGVAAALAAPEVHWTLYNIVSVHFNVGEQTVLRKLAKASGPLTADDLASNTEDLDELRRRHYVRPAGEGFVSAFGLLGRWLLGQAPFDGGHKNAPVIAKLMLDENRRCAAVGDREIRLTQQEYRFLQRLMREPGTVVERAAVAAAVWPDESGFGGGRDSRLAQLVHRLRTVLGDDNEDTKYIETHRGFGFSVNVQNVEFIPGGQR